MAKERIETKNKSIIPMDTLEYLDNNYTINRYPKTTDNSLKAWSNAELLALEYCIEKENKNIHLYNDRFGVWNCALNQRKTNTILNYSSQKKAILQNLETNNLNTDLVLKTSLDDLKTIELALVKIPKSIELFELYLQQIHKASDKNTEVVCCFMTKYFSKSLLKIAENYFDDISQSKAWKKARLLILKQPKEINKHKLLINEIEYKDTILKQYYGVFSSSKIDFGTQLLLDNLQLKENEKAVLDVASGNGVIAKTLASKYTNICLVDDFDLAIESSKLNLKEYNATFIWDNNLNTIEDNIFDIVVSNPPFHFEYENNIEVSLSLFRGVKRVLKNQGRFVLVANKHLNYKTHLIKIFQYVDIIKENDKFTIYECSL